MYYHRIIAMNVTDPVGYKKYRDAMIPMLHAVGGKFSYDFDIARTFISEAKHPVTRVFMISFPSREIFEKLFADPEYQKIRKEYHAASVDGYTTLAEIED